MEYDFNRTPTKEIVNAIKCSAAHFRKKRTIRLRDIHYGHSRIQMPFGKWVSARIIGELGKARRTAGETINVLDAVYSGRTAETQDFKLAQKFANREMAASPTDDYILSDRYWVLGEKVDVQLLLRDDSDNVVTWQGDVRANSIDLPLESDEAHQSERDGDRLGPVLLLVHSNRGANPIYQTVQKMILFIETSRDGYLYCIYRQAGGTNKPIFPNQFHLNAFLPGGKDLQISGPSI